MFEFLKDNFKRNLSLFLAFSALLTVFTSFEADMSVCAQENTDLQKRLTNIKNFGSLIVVTMNGFYQIY